MPNKNLFCLFILLSLLFSACTPRVQVSTPMPFPSITATASSTPTLIPITPTVSGNPNASAAPPPTVTPTSTLSAMLPSMLNGKATWENEQHGFAILYPQEWHAAKPTNPEWVRFEGKDGYVEMKGFFLAGGLDALRDCRLESLANRDERYGAQPEIETTWWNSNRGDQFLACVVRSKDQPEQRPQLHYITSTRMVGYALIETGESAQNEVTFMDVPIVAQTTPTHLPTTPPDQPIQSSFLDFTIRQWRIAPADPTKDKGIYFSDSPNNYPLLARRYNALEADRIPVPAQLKQINTDLAPFGYQLKSNCKADCKDPTYQLFQGVQIIKEGLKSYRQFSISADRKNFVLGLTDKDYQDWLLTTSGLERYQLQAHHYNFPMYMGQHLISLSGEWDIVVEKDGQPVFTRQTSSFQASPPVPNMFVLDGHWALEIQGEFIVDGEIWNITKFPANDIFNVRFFDDKLFFFYRHGTQIGIYYDGQTFPTNFSVIHHAGCCGYGMNNPFNFSRSINFFAMEDGMWNYVEIRKGGDLTGD